MNEDIQRLTIIVQDHLQNSNLPHRQARQVFKLINKQSNRIQQLEQQLKEANGD